MWNRDQSRWRDGGADSLLPVLSTRQFSAWWYAGLAVPSRASPIHGPAPRDVGCGALWLVRFSAGGQRRQTATSNSTLRLARQRRQSIVETERCPHGRAAPISRELRSETVPLNPSLSPPPNGDLPRCLVSVPARPIIVFSKVSPFARPPTAHDGTQSVSRRSSKIEVVQNCDASPCRRLLALGDVP